MFWVIGIKIANKASIAIHQWPYFARAFQEKLTTKYTKDTQKKQKETHQNFTAKIAKGNWRIYEVSISYAGRTYSEGKKITWRDGISTLWCILRYNLFD